MLISIFIYAGLNVTNDNWPDKVLGKPAPNIALPLLIENREVSLNELIKGKLSILVFWSTYCEVCESYLRNLLAFKQKYPIYVVGILGKDDVSNSLKYLENVGFPFDVILKETDLKYQEAFNILTYGETIIVGKNGVVMKRFFGDDELGELTQEYLSEYFAK